MQHPEIINQLVQTGQVKINELGTLYFPRVASHPDWNQLTKQAKREILGSPPNMKIHFRLNIKQLRQNVAEQLEYQSNHD